MDLKQFNLQQQKQAAPRVQRIMRLRAAGETLKTIADLLDISRERVRQIVAREIKRNGKFKAHAK